MVALFLPTERKDCARNSSSVASSIDGFDQTDGLIARLVRPEWAKHHGQGPILENSFFVLVSSPTQSTVHWHIGHWHMAVELEVARLSKHGTIYYVVDKVDPIPGPNGPQDRTPLSTSGKPKMGKLPLKSIPMERYFG